MKGFEKDETTELSENIYEYLTNIKLSGLSDETIIASLCVVVTHYLVLNIDKKDQLRYIDVIKESIEEINKDRDI